MNALKMYVNKCKQTLHRPRPRQANPTSMATSATVAQHTVIGTRLT